MICFYFNFDLYLPSTADISKIPGKFLISANLGFALYIFLIIISLNKLRFFKKFILPDFSLEKINRNLINKFSIFLFLFLLITCIPYWIDYGIQNTGLYTLFFDPVAHFLAREETIKLAINDNFLRFYLIGSRISLLLIPLLIIKFLKSKNFIKKSIYFLVIIFVILICNINGSRSFFIRPLFVTSILFYMTNTFNIRFALIETFINFKKNFKIKIKNFKNILLLFLIISLSFASMVLISLFAANRLNYLSVLPNVFLSVFYRIFLSNYNTGPINIMAINELNIPILSYLGGFPGASFLIGYEGESVFRIVGNYAGYKFYGITNDTNNMNTSGLFLNIGFYGTVFGTLIFYLSLIFNLWVAKFVLINANKYFKFDLKALSILTTFWLLADSSFEVYATTFGLFPMRWIYFFSVLFAFAFVKQRNLKF